MLEIANMTNNTGNPKFGVLQEGDSAGTKLSGSVINALIFVGIIAVTTFIMVLLFKYRVCSEVGKVYIK